MDLDDEPVSASSYSGSRHRLDVLPMAGTVARVDEDRQVSELLQHRDGVEVEREARGGLERPDAALAEDHVGLPPLRTYSAESSHSWIDVAMPRLSSTGFLASATRLSNEKFWTLRAPIWRMSAYSATTSTLSGSITSVTIGRPVSRLASARNFRPASSRPWNA